jgi:ABC-type uncharacterized transport system ATPase subunit
MSRDRATAAARDWLARFRIADLADRRAESLSKGNQQKVQFIATVLHDPDVLLMDVRRHRHDRVEAPEGRLSATRQRRSASS